jgi:hypothetical protein
LTAIDSQLESVIELRHEIEGIDRAARNPGADAMIRSGTELSYSYGLFSGLSPVSKMEQAVAGIVASIHAVLAKLAPVATIETSIDGMTARTVIQYTGRAASVWSNAASSQLAASLEGAHLESLRRAYALRVAFVGAISAAGSALVSISLAVANPLTVLHALSTAIALKRALERLSAAVEAAV